jgi:hypothetical protein
LPIAYSPTENSPFVASILIFPNREMSRGFQATCKQSYKPGDCAGTSLHVVESNPAPEFDGGK